MKTIIHHKSRLFILIILIFSSINGLTQELNRRVNDEEAGEEILIGGLIKEKSNINNYRVPILGHVPLLKMFFSSRKTEDETLQLIILVKPSIVPEQEV